MKTPDGHFIAHSELEWTMPLPIKRVVDPVVAQYVMQLRDSLRWCIVYLGETNDTEIKSRIEHFNSLLGD